MSSTEKTLSPRATQASTICEPTKPMPPVTKILAMLLVWFRFFNSADKFKQFFIVAAHVGFCQTLRSQHGAVIRAHGLKQADSFFKKTLFRAFRRFLYNFASVSDNRSRVFGKTITAVSAVMLIFNVKPCTPDSLVLGQNMADVVVVYFGFNAIFIQRFFGHLREVVNQIGKRNFQRAERVCRVLAELGFGRVQLGPPVRFFVLGRSKTRRRQKKQK